MNPTTYEFFHHLIEVRRLPWDETPVGEWAAKYYPLIARKLNKEYLRRYPPQPEYLPYDDYDQSEEDEESLKISRREALSSKVHSGFDAVTWQVRRDPLRGWVGSFPQVPGWRV
jgi:hypothetical protein